MNEIPTIEYLHKQKNIKNAEKEQIYNLVLNKCIDKISKTNNNTEFTYIFFEVPQIIIGVSSYDMKSCIIYLINNLSLYGYTIDFIDPCYIRIDWGVKPIKHVNIIVPEDNEIDFKQQTRDLLKKYPNTSNIEFIYEEKKEKRKGKKQVKRKK